MKRFLILLALGALALAACGASDGRVAVQNAWARPIAAGNNAAVYFSITNGSASDDVLTGASSDLARAVEIHESMMVSEDSADMGDDEGGMAMGNDVMQMTPVESLSLAAGESVTFEPGGYHVMLIDINQDLVQGESFEITLHFDGAGDVPVQVQVDQR